MTTNVLQITTVGLNAIASVPGGFRVSVNTFKIGDGQTPPSKDDINLSGNTVHIDLVSLVEVLSPGVARFTLDLPPSIDSYPINEIGLYLADGTLFARGTFSTPMIKDALIGIRIFAVVTATNCDLTKLDVTVGQIYSIPSVATVASLPPPNGNLQCNAIAVLDLKYNFDSSASGSIAVRYGDGSKMWSFLGYSRIHLGSPDSGAVLTHSVFQLAAAITSPHYTLVDNELIIVQIVSGSGEGESRRFRFSTTSTTFTEVDGVPFTAIDSASTLALWRATESNNVIVPDNQACKWPPAGTANTPAGWVLATQAGGNCPTWISPKGLGTTTNTSGLFVSPGDLQPNVVCFTGDGAKVAFDTGLILTMMNTLISIDGITQHKDAYDVQDTYVLFSEAPPSGTAIEVIAYQYNTSTGTSLEFHTSIIDTTDGVTTQFDVGVDFPSSVPASEIYPPDATYLMCYITGIKQNLNAFLYKVDPHTGAATITFNEAPASGLKIQLTWIRKRANPNYTTIMYLNSFLGTGNQEVFNLSITPTDKNYTFVYVSGILMHNDTYTLSGNRLIITDSIKKDLSINVVIFNNEISGGAPSPVLAGIVTGAMVTNKYLTLLRYNAPDFLIPNPQVNIMPGNGIQVSGNFPNYTISSITNTSIRNIETRRFANLYSLDNVEEIIYTYPFDFAIDTIVMVTVDFSMRLGPGFKSTDGGEYIEYVLGFKTQGVTEPPYGRRVKGTGIAGFSYLTGAQTAFANASISQSFELDVPSGQTTDSVTFVAKMHIVNGNVSKYKSALDLNFSLVATPKNLQITV